MAQRKNKRKRVSAGVNAKRTTRSRQPKLKKNVWMELVADVNCIPAGIYRLRYVHGDTHVFEIGKRVQFSVANFKHGSVRRLVQKPPKERRTTAQDFVARYYELMGQIDQGVAFDPELPFTSAAFAPELAAPFEQSERLH